MLQILCFYIKHFVDLNNILTENLDCICSEQNSFILVLFIYLFLVSFIYYYSMYSLFLSSFFI